jgi:hypothetical protein
MARAQAVHHHWSQKGSSMKEFVLDTELPTDVMGIEQPMNIAPNSVVAIQTMPQVPVRPFALFIPREICSGLLIQDVRIGMDSYLLSSGPIPAELFAWACVHDDCNGRNVINQDGTLPTQEEHLALMKACIEKHPNQPRVIHRWNLGTALPGMIISTTIQNRSLALVSFQAAWLVNRL